MPIVNGGLTKNNASSLNNGLTYILKANGNILTPTISNTFTRATAAYNPETGALVASGNPRYVSGRAGQGIFIEEGTTNLLSASNDFNNATWIVTNVARNKDAVDPFGAINNAWTFTTANGVSNTFVKASDSFSNATSYTWSIFAKAGTGSNLIYQRVDNGSYIVTTFNLSTGIISGVTTGAQMTTVGNGWYRCSIAFTTGAVGVQTLSTIYLDAWGAATGVKTFYMYGYQLEQKAYATTYQDSANATRNAETLTFNPTGVITPTQGTISVWVYVAAGSVWRDTSSRVFVWGTSSSGNNNRMNLEKNGGNVIATAYNSSGTLSEHAIATTLSVGWHNLTVCWNSSELSLSIDGVKQSNPTTNPNIPSAVGSSFFIGATKDGTLQANTTLDNFRIYNRVLSASEIMQLYRSGK